MEFGDGGGGEVFLFANGGEGLGEERGAAEQESERKPAKEHEAKVSKI